MKVIFFGTSSFAARVLKCLVEEQVGIQAIVTRVDRPQGRHLEVAYPPVKKMARDICPHIPLYQPIKASSPEFLPVLEAHHPDLFVVVAYGEIIKQHVLDLPRKGCINIHASLLPLYRGAAPIQRCLMDGVKEAGISIIEMTSQMDAGDILVQESLPVSPHMTFGELEPELCRLGCELILKVIEQIGVGSQKKESQDSAQATFAPKITAAEERIDWSRKAGEIHNLVRALSPLPGAWCPVRLGSQEKRLKIKRSLVEEGLQGAPGTLLIFSQQGCAIACGSGALRLLEVQIEGKRVMPIMEFMKGMHQPIQFL